MDLVERLSAELDRVTARLEPHFSRREAHEAARGYVKALVSRAERKNAWGLSEEARQADPYAFQHLVRRARWDEGAVREEVQGDARQHLGRAGYWQWTRLLMVSTKRVFLDRSPGVP